MIINKCTKFTYESHSASYKKLLLGFSVFFFVLSYLLSNFSLVPFNFFNSSNELGSNFRINHLFAILLILTIIFQTKITILNKKVFFLFSIFLFLLFYSFIISLFWKLNYYIVNYILSLFIFIASGNVFKKIDINFLLRILSKSTIVFFILVVIKNIFYRQSFFEFLLMPSVHPNVISLIGGGLNIEATMLSMMTLFTFKNKKLFYFLIIISLIISISYSSRIGVISTLLAFLLVSFFYSKNKIHFIIYSSIFLIIFLIILLNTDSYISQRFLRIFDKTEAGSGGRINMWVWILPTIINNIFGYGIGNSIYALEYTSKISFFDNNIHLYPIQVFLDFGFLGFILFIFIFIFIFIKTLTVKNDSFIFYAFLFMYLILGFVQFKGGESLIYMIGSFAITYNRKLQC